VGLTLRLLQFYHQLPKTSELGRATTAHITVVVYFRDHYHWFRVCSFAELSSAFIIPPPRALQSSTSTIQTFFLQSYITRAWGMPASFVHTCILFHTLWKVGSTGSCLLQRIALHGLTLALPYHTILSKRNIDEFRLYVLLLTSSIRGHLLSLKFRPHRATRTPHHQHRKTVIHGTRLIPQHSKRVKTIQNGQKITKRFAPTGRARARNIFVPGAHMRGCGVKNPRACQTAHLWNWSASQPLMDRLPSRFDTKSELNLRGEAGQRPNCALKSPFSHSKEVA
jgi:hypothetical protein